MYQASQQINQQLLAGPGLPAFLNQAEQDAWMLK
jgi:hypothetical protein